MASIATDALPVFALFAPAFTPATFSRAQLLAVAAILTTGRRTVSNLLRTLGHLAVGAPQGQLLLRDRRPLCFISSANTVAASGQVRQQFQPIPTSNVQLAQSREQAQRVRLIRR